MIAPAAVAALLCLTGGARAASFVEPTVFASAGGVLDILMIAKAEPVSAIAFVPPGGGAAINPTGWVFEICRRPPNANVCPPGSGSFANYGGVRLALKKGDSLKVRLINRLPAIDPAKLAHVNDPGQANLLRNPTNLHTHGLIVPARAPTVRDPTFGDYVFVSLFNPSNGIPIPQTEHQHGLIKMGMVDYRIDIPANHPSGLFWFHPHIHGIALNQVTQGMAGIITIGNAGDYARGDTGSSPFPEASVRHLTLKDTQVLAAGTYGEASYVNGEVQHQQDPDFCAQFPARGELRRGVCPGQDNSGSGGENYTGGRWYFTVSGRQYPTIRMTDPDGEVWRLTNASASLAYDLQLVNDASRKPMVMQLIAVDGVSINLPQDTPANTTIQLAGAKFKVLPCPPAAVLSLRSLPVCIDELTMMSSSRAEVWVTYRNANDRVAASPPGASATFKMIGLTMGSGDLWPAVDLAKVVFAQGPQRRLTSAALDIAGDALATAQPSGIFNAANPGAQAANLPAGCKPLPPGHRRRIFFGFEDVATDGTFALGYEEVDQNGRVVAGSERPVKRFDPTQEIVCLPLGPGQTPVREVWELVQLSTENHNFHIHQTKFRVVNPTAAASALLSPRVSAAIGNGILQDNVPLGVASAGPGVDIDGQNGVCTVQQWRSGQCTATTVVVDIPFSQLGEFVYHCHILEHEDGGMMAKIRVVPSPM